MPDPKHSLEQDRDELALQLDEYKTAIVEALRGPNGRPLFTRQLTKSQALAWWQQNYDTPYGRQLYEQKTPEQRMELDRELAQQNAAAMWGIEQ